MFSWLSSFFQTPEVTPELKKSIQSTIESNKIVVYSKSYCPYCTSTKQILSQNGVNPTIIELNQITDGSSIQQGLYEITGQRTVPNIFINGEHIGGNSDLVDLNSKGLLKSKLNALAK
ncbi:hypothetical protein KGF54_005469 [Candida jiufengensis]|uniref:uncharacterized protein n=1 Tax=Candida jiufengensis TaxID=497108 RepID=UPI0022245EB8|nr:uncharacterized protein KGF54_005469 [Candida jiufengensis]KAI5949592.1 hypothetical protein KGF54_005469 [Candida jiufengensis]